jgi:hypothetical protein
VLEISSSASGQLRSTTQRIDAITGIQQPQKYRATRDYSFRSIPHGHCSWSPSTSHDTQSNIGSISGSIFDRNTKSFVAEPSIESFFVGPISTLPIVSMPADTESVLFAYCGNQLLPSLIHRQAHARYLDFSYWSSMAMTHEPLMDAALAWPHHCPGRPLWTLSGG